MWRSLNSQIQGRGHARAAVPCQDRTFCLAQNGVHVAALADGAGSAPLSHFGAEEAARRVSRYLAENFGRLMLSRDAAAARREMIACVLGGLRGVAARHGCELADLASTLLAVAVTNEEYIVVHIGDGVVACLAGDEVKAASAPDNGEYANSTVFITSPDAEKSLRLMRGRLGPIRGFALMSDGAASALFQKQTRAFARALKTLMLQNSTLACDETPETLRRLLLLVRASHTADDCAIALLGRVGGTPDEFFSLPPKRRGELLGVRQTPRGKALLKRREGLLRLLPAALKDIARALGLKPRFLRRRLKSLRGVVSERDGVCRFDI